MKIRGNAEVKLKRQALNYARVKHSEFSNAYIIKMRCEDEGLSNNR